MKVIEANKLAEALNIEGYMKTGWLPTSALGVPIIEAEPTHYAYWEDEGNDEIYCSECGTWFPNDRVEYMHYCPYCGAKMSYVLTITHNPVIEIKPAFKPNDFNYINKLKQDIWESVNGESNY